MSAKLWGGRFTGKTDPVMEQFNNSISYDKIMWKEDIEGSIQYSKALAKCGILTNEEAQKIGEGLELVRKEWEEGKFELKPSDEDIHTANERRLTELIGSTGGKLHTGRSRNDQVATDVRLWLRGSAQKILIQLHEIINISTHLAESKVDILQAGFTHLQPAQVIRFSHWLLSHTVPLLRDVERLQQCIDRINICPLGSGALAGHPFGIDRIALAESLHFKDVSLNSLDATSDRDFIAEFMNWSSVLMVHLSQFAEDVIILNTQKCIQMSDAYCTGSSLMPQKKNPDALELLRGKSGRVIGHANGFMITLKGLPRAYNKDLQEDKEPLFDTVSTITNCLMILNGILSTMEPVEANLKKVLVPEMLATDIAEYLASFPGSIIIVRKGVPFRDTHHIAGAAVKLAETKNIPLDHLTVTDLQTLHPQFETDVSKIWSYETSAESRNSLGGTSKAMVLKQIELIRQKLQTLSDSRSSSSSSSSIEEEHATKKHKK